ncbi:DUF6357 family protein [Micromonospora sp. NPDC000207]|uniref:DUF6357 family protein n=1 Tax=Micromonospora sp. NPDC000207 TaxID=3154246 RepID=UPI003333C909
MKALGWTPQPDLASVRVSPAYAQARVHGTPPESGATDRRDWDRMAATVEAAVRRAYPGLVDDAVRTVSFLMCSEAADRSRSTPVEDDEEAADDHGRLGEGARKTALSFTDDKGGEKKWVREGSRTASAEFWEFVADRSAGDNEVFTIEDGEMGEGIQLHFYADSVARITTVRPGEAGSDPQYLVEYSLVDGIGGHRNVVTACVRGGCAALEPYGPWMSDVAEFERARRRIVPERMRSALLSAHRCDRRRDALCKAQTALIG